MRAMQGSSGIDVNSPNKKKVGEESQPRHSAAEVRRTIVLLFGEDKKMTPDEVERAVALKLPDARHGLVSGQMRVLLDGKYLGPVKEDSRQLALTEAGRRWLSGIRALSGG
jgi:hypothetical protein